MALRATFRRFHYAHIPPPPLLFSPQHVRPAPRTNPEIGGSLWTGTGTEKTVKRPFSAEAVSHPSNRVQVYVSRSTDPYLNLSVEHFLLQRSAPDSVVLFLYANRPCVVIGRNQNPWVEADPALVGEPGALARLRAEQLPHGGKEQGGLDGDDGNENDTVLLVRRRSGGGAVFHDAGNLNYSVICPPPSFDRDKHAEMVVRALRRLGAAGARVNERHDIVLDVPSSFPSSSSSSSSSHSHSHSHSHSSAEKEKEKEKEAEEGKKATFKISGSAYKLTRQRSLHHGTCLLASPNLALIGRVLRAPAAPYVRARGVESVRSPVRNVGVRDVGAFEDAVVAEFGLMYGGGSGSGSGNAMDVQILGGVGEGGDVALRHIPEIRKGWEELRSPEWTYTQTPQFTFSTHPTAAGPRPRPEPAPAGGLRMSMTVRHGQIAESELRLPTAGGSLSAGEGLVGTYLHRVRDWRDLVPGPHGEWLNGIFGVARQPSEGGGKGFTD
ncbi:hypothetical protein F5X99DRAFT_125475 [Biscogniauxia marginata]|nr:hypothetical protein F5X99DRAFT_125475 [Biscogniauxia marginata]